MLVKLDETPRLVETLVMENTSLEKKVKNLEVELSQARTQIKRMSSAKLDKVLSAQKPNSDKTGLGYAVFSSPPLPTLLDQGLSLCPNLRKVIQV